MIKMSLDEMTNLILQAFNNAGLPLESLSEEDFPMEHWLPLISIREE